MCKDNIIMLNYKFLRDVLYYLLMHLLNNRKIIKIILNREVVEKNIYPLIWRPIWLLHHKIYIIFNDLLKIFNVIIKVPIKIKQTISSEKQ